MSERASKKNNAPSPLKPSEHWKEYQARYPEGLTVADLLRKDKELAVKLTKTDELHFLAESCQELKRHTTEQVIEGIPVTKGAILTIPQLNAIFVSTGKAAGVDLISRRSKNQMFTTAQNTRMQPEWQGHFGKVAAREGELRAQLGYTSQLGLRIIEISINKRQGISEADREAWLVNARAHFDKNIK